MKTYEQFRKDLGDRENSGRYGTKNPFGYLGKYQFGMARLTDLGLCHRGPDGKFQWNEGMSEEIFLGSPKLQERVFDVHVSRYREHVTLLYSRFFGKTILGTIITLSGCIACCHLLGPGGLRDFCVKGLDKEDAFGTKASDYIGLFAGYDVPTNLPTNVGNLSLYVNK